MWDRLLFFGSAYPDAVQGVGEHVKDHQEGGDDDVGGGEQATEKQRPHDRAGTLAAATATATGAALVPQPFDDRSDDEHDADGGHQVGDLGEAGTGSFDRVPDGIPGTFKVDGFGCEDGENEHDYGLPSGSAGVMVVACG